MGFIGILMSMAQNDTAFAGRQAALLAGLANEGINSGTATIQFGYASPTTERRSTKPKQIPWCRRRCRR